MANNFHVMFFDLLPLALKDILLSKLPAFGFIEIMRLEGLRNFLDHSLEQPSINSCFFFFSPSPFLTAEYHFFLGEKNYSCVTVNGFPNSFQTFLPIAS